MNLIIKINRKKDKKRKLKALTRQTHQAIHLVRFRHRRNSNLWLWMGSEELRFQNPAFQRERKTASFLRSGSRETRKF